MEIQDGFIVGIFNYCDRWCERCALTNRCRLFADMARADFEYGNGSLTEPRLLRERRRLAAEMIEIAARAEELSDKGASMTDTPLEHLPADLECSPGPDPEILAKADALRGTLRTLQRSPNPAVRLAAETIQYFSLFVPMKMMRALSQVARHGPGSTQSDANGSGKVALLALERMEAAWRTLIETQHYSARDAAPFLAEIARMQRNLERALPTARDFVRPGFDEHDEVRMLDASEC
jgi:hypothetical protein